MLAHRLVIGELEIISIEFSNSSIRDLARLWAMRLLRTVP
jgi:hypothetical protein